MSLLDSVVIGPAVFVGIVISAGLFYHLHNGWELSTALFFAAQTLLGCNYSGPRESEGSKFFTLGLYILGTTLIAGAVSVFASTIVNNARGQVPQYWRDEENVPDVSSWSHRILIPTIVVLWLGLGVCWGMWHEGFDLSQAIYFAVGAMSARGDPEPLMICDKENSNSLSSCNFGLARSLFYALYCIVGVNLYLLFMSKFAGLLCERAVRAHERFVLNRPLAQEELEFALSLSAPPAKKAAETDESLPQSLENEAATSAGSESKTLADTDTDTDTRIEPAPISTPLFHSSSLDLRDLVILELLRLGRVDRAFIEEIRTLFNAIDADGNGRLDLLDLRCHHRKYYGERGDVGNVEVDADGDSGGQGEGEGEGEGEKEEGAAKSPPHSPGRSPGHTPTPTRSSSSSSSHSHSQRHSHSHRHSHRDRDRDRDGAEQYNHDEYNALFVPLLLLSASASKAASNSKRAAATGSGSGSGSGFVNDTNADTDNGASNIDALNTERGIRPLRLFGGVGGGVHGTSEVVPAAPGSGDLDSLKVAAAPGSPGRSKPLFLKKNE